MKDKNSLVMVGDMDTLVYLSAYQNRLEENVDNVLFDIDTFVQSLITNTSCTHYIGFLGGSKETFRNQISSTYKANRPESPDWYKKWGGIIKAHLRDKWKFIVVNNIEADDAVSIAAHELRLQNINHIIVGADKDLLQIEGNHYNLRTHKRSFIDSLEASKSLYRQIIQGDKIDAIEGLGRGYGPKKAAGFINGLDDALNMECTCIELFTNKYGDKEGLKLFEMTFALCKLLSNYNPYTHLELDYIEVPRQDIPSSLDSMNEVIADIWG